MWAYPESPDTGYRTVVYRGFDAYVLGRAVRAIYGRWKQEGAHLYVFCGSRKLRASEQRLSSLLGDLQ